MVTPSEVLQNLELSPGSQHQPARCIAQWSYYYCYYFVLLWWRHYLGRRGLHKGHDLSKETIFTQNNHVSTWTKPFNENQDFSRI